MKIFPSRNDAMWFCFYFASGPCSCLVRPTILTLEHLKHGRYEVYHWEVIE